jgi:hypothetical protein
MITAGSPGTAHDGDPLAAVVCTGAAEVSVIRGRPENRWRR